MEKVRQIFENRLFLLLCRIVLGFVFIYASSDKILHPDQFADILYNYKILPGFLIHPLTLFLPWIELIAGSFILAGVNVKASAFIINILLITFILAISFNLIRGLSFDCGCFSTAPGSGKESAYFLLLRDILLLFPGYLLYKNHQSNRRNNEK